MARAPSLRMPRPSLAGFTPRRWLHLPSRTVRLRLTLLYSGLFLVSGLALIATTYLLFRSTTGVDLIATPCRPPRHSDEPRRGAPSTPHVRHVVATPQPRSPRGTHRVRDRARVHAAVSIAVGWLVAGRVLAPFAR